MKIAAPRPWLLPLLGGLTLATPALAQHGDEPTAYPEDNKSDEESTPTRRRRVQPEDKPESYPDDEGETPQRSSRKRPVRPSEDTDRDFRHAAEDEDEPKKNFKRLAGLDDPNTGIAFELLGGVMGLSSPRAQLLGDLLPAVGGRFTWEYGRLLNEETLREALWFDVRYMYTGESDGTKLIMGTTQVHYATIAPAYELTFGEGSDYGVYAQVGGGAAYEHTVLQVGNKSTPVDGFKPVLQYGVGLRGRTPLSTDPNLRLAWRLELTRFRRGYMDDTYLGVSAGVAF